MANETFTGHRSNLTFFGDIIGDVALAPFKCGYRLGKHKASASLDTHVQIGPIIRPDFQDDVDLTRTPGEQRTHMRGVELWREFTNLQPNTNSFIRFANSYGLLGATRTLTVPTNFTSMSVAACDPLVDWFQHYCKLNLLRTALANDQTRDDYVEMVKSQESSLKRIIQPRFSEVTKQEIGKLPTLIGNRDITGVEINGNIHPPCWNFIDANTAPAIVKAAFELLTFEISRHSTVVVRQRDRRQKLTLGDNIDVEEEAHLANNFVVTTTLAANSLIGAMYIGVLLEMCKYRTRRNIRPCEHCGKFLLNEHLRTKYCSGSCKKKAFRAKHNKGPKQNG